MKFFALGVAMIAALAQARADTAALLRGAARAAVEIRPGASVACIVAFMDSLGTPAGRTFVTEGVAAARALPAPDRRMALQDFTLLSLVDGDTVRVLIELNGANGPSSRQYYTNRISIRFVRDAGAEGWRRVARETVGWGDSVVTDTTSPPPAPARCLNGTR